MAIIASEPLNLDVIVVFAQITTATNGKIELPLARVF